MQLESLEELRVFAQVVESGSMSGAARVLGLPANTVSRRIASLEERVGVRLLNRTTRSVGLSEHGRALLAPTHQVLESVERAEAALRRDRSGLSGVVRIGVPSVLTGDILPALQPLLQEHPGLRLELSVHDRPVNPVSVGLDVLIMGGVLDDSTLVARKLDQVTLVYAASQGYLAEHGEPRTPADLTAHRTLHFRMNPPQSSWTLTDAQGEQHTVPVSGQLEADDGRALVDALRAGMGIGATSERVLRAHPELRRVLPGYRGFSFPVYAIYPTSGQRSARLQAVVGALERVVT
jgi:DNA-binding transcriptional LysR family regulator